MGKQKNISDHFNLFMKFGMCFMKIMCFLFCRAYFFENNFAKTKFVYIFAAANG